jgi:quercetin dioxygenase-like cupin family protein
MKSTISHVILRKHIVETDWRIWVLPKEKNNGRKVLVNEILREAERPIDDPEWKPEPPPPPAGHTPVLETGYGGVEVATFTEKAGQDRHKHLASMEIYTILEGTMTIRIEDKQDVILQAGDEVVILPGVVREVLDKGTSFLTRLHAINCHGLRDKYVEEKSVWCQAMTLKNKKDAGTMS